MYQLRTARNFHPLFRRHMTKTNRNWEAGIRYTPPTNFGKFGNNDTLSFDKGFHVRSAHMSTAPIDEMQMMPFGD